MSRVPDGVKQHVVFSAAKREGWAVGGAEPLLSPSGRRVVILRIQDGDSRRGALYFSLPARGRVMFNGLVIFPPFGSRSKERSADLAIPGIGSNARSGSTAVALFGSGVIYIGPADVQGALRALARGST